MNKQMPNYNDAQIEKFLKQYSPRPTDKGFTHRVMQRLPKRRSIFNWNDILKYFCYTLAAVTLIVFGGLEMIKDIIAAPDGIVGLFARIAKYGIYITIIGLGAVGYFFFETLSSEDRRLLFK